MKTIVDDVAAFHTACDVPVLTSPQIPTPERVALRVNLITEEVVNELFPAMENRDLPGIADAIADAIYVLVGTALEYGIPLAQVWDAVQTANMAKVDSETGKVRKRFDGKVMKPENWQKPDIAAILVAAQEAAAA